MSNGHLAAGRAHSARKKGALFQQGFDAVKQTFGLGDRRKARDALAVGGEQKLGEIPLDAAATQNAGRQAFQLIEQRVRAGAVNVYLAEQRETDAVVEAILSRTRPGGARLPLQPVWFSGAGQPAGDRQLLQPQLRRQFPAVQQDRR